MFHDFIIWSNATTIKDVVVEDLRSCFDLYRIFKFHWEKNDFINNLTTFYSHSQSHLSERQYYQLLIDKIKHCGDGDFYVIVVEDKNPIMEYRATSSGNSLVNINVFDKKTAYRYLSGGGHKIHGSNDEWETNKDLITLFGKCISDFCVAYPKEESYIEEYKGNCLGTHGFDSMAQLFYLLNNTLKYCVLRNHECLPDKYTIEGHGDIDLLVENKNYVKYLTQAKDVFGVSYRVYHTIRVAGKEVPFDFRYVGDNYYDEEWERNILKTRHLLQKGFYVPDNENQYYTLLYHAYVQKPKVANDYERKLALYAFPIHEIFVSTSINAIDSLDGFMKRNAYEYVRPNDKTVYYNFEFLKHSQYAFRHGKLVSKLVHDETHVVPFFSVVYEKEQSFYKRGSDFLIENEIRFLQKLSQYECFPKVLVSGVADDGAWVETARVEGKSMDVFFSTKRNNNPLMVRAFLKGTIAIIRILVENGIQHRDFVNKNILIKEEVDSCRVSLIDFGWAIDIARQDCCLKPDGLGDGFQPKEGYSDFYTLGSVLDYQWHEHGVPYIKRIAGCLKSVESANYENVNSLLRKLDMVDELIYQRFSIRDRIEFFAYRHRTFGKYWRKTKKVLKCFSKRVLRLGRIILKKTKR